MFTTKDMEARGFVEKHSSEGMWEYKRFYDEVPEEVQKAYQEKPRREELDCGDKHYKVSNAYCGGKPYYYVSERLVNSLFEKGEYGELWCCVHYHKDSGVVEYIRFGSGNWGDGIYCLQDCRRASFVGVLEDYQTKLEVLIDEEDKSFLKILNELMDKTRRRKKELETQLKEIDL